MDNKDDHATEVGTNCQFKCKEEDGDNSFWGTGSPKPYDTYSYCVNTKYWDRVAKCVDKKSGKDVGNNLCENDTNGAQYYFKPKCDEKDTKASCYQKLQAITRSLEGEGYGWRFCYYYSDPAPPSEMRRNGNGQSVVFQEYINIQGDASFPCETRSTNMQGGNPITDTKPEVLGNLVIIDWADSNQPVSKVHTKISGTANDFKIYEQNGKLDSGIETLKCEIRNSEGAITYSGDAGSKFSFLSAFGFKFSAPTSAMPTSGAYKIKCVGTSKQGNSVSAEVGFFVAPHSYQFGVVNAEFDNAAKGGIATESLLEKKGNKIEPLKIQYNETKEITHNNEKWTKKPVVKIDESIKVNINEIQALNALNVIDLGVDKENNIGLMGVDINGNTKTTLKAISNADTTPPTTSVAGGACNPAILMNANDAEMEGGKITKLETILKLSTDNALVGDADVEIFDKGLQDKIKDQETNGLCSTAKGSAFPCPYPAKLKAKFEYQIVPANFKAELLDKNDNPLKVLYFGMGQTPKVEGTTKLRVTALKSANLADNLIATTFSNSCASQNLTLNMELKGEGFSIDIVDTDGKDFIIKGKDFKDGIADAEGIVKVNKDENTPFTPNMKSEPVFTGDKYPNGFPAKMEFAGFSPNSSYYPNYASVNVNPNDPIVILRARINAIDTDNAPKFGVANPTKVYYEFQCEYCNLDKVGAITGVKNYDRSPTQQGWWIDSTFGENNQTRIDKNKIEIENLGNAKIQSVSDIANGVQQISYSVLGAATYKLNILHGNYTQGGTAISMPNFLLYNAYWTENIKWHTSAFIYIKGQAKDENRNYGIDTGGAKNTRSGGRTGKY